MACSTRPPTDGCGPCRSAIELDQLERDSVTDPLTGLINRRGLERVLVQSSGRRRSGDEPVSVVLLDVDDFKLVNDRLGHAVGDEVLRRLGTLIRRTVRPDDVCARLGGEEFVVVLAGCDLAGAHRVADDLRRAIAGTDDWARLDPLLQVTVSVGVAPLGAGPGASEMLAPADRAMYVAKDAGKNRSSRDGGAPVRRVVSDDGRALTASQLVGREGVAGAQVALAVAGREPPLALLAGAVRERLGTHLALDLLLDAVVADRRRRRERVGDVVLRQLLQERLAALGVDRPGRVVRPDAREAVGHQLDAHRTGLRALRVALRLAEQVELVLDVVAELVRDDELLGQRALAGAEPLAERVEEPRVEVGRAVGRTVEGPTALVALPQPVATDPSKMTRPGGW